MIAVVPSFIAVASRKIVITADLLPPSHRRRGATAVLVRHKPQLRSHDRSGSAVVPSLIAVAPRKTVNIADFRGGTAETLNMCNTSAVLPRVGPMSWPPRHRHDRRSTVRGPQCHLHHRRASAVQSPYNREQVDWRPLRRSRGVSTAVTAVLPRCYHLIGPAVLPPTPQLSRQSSPWHRHQTAFVTQRNRRGKLWKNYWRCHCGDGGFDQKP